MPTKQQIVFVLGNGFSMGLGFPNQKELMRQSFTKYSDNSTAHVYRLENNEHERTLVHYKDTANDLEDLISKWHSEMEIYEAENPNANANQSGRGDLDDYLKNVYGLLYKYGQNAMNDKGYFKHFCNFNKEVYFKRQLGYDIRFISLNYDYVIELMLKCFVKRFCYVGEPTQAKDEVVIRKLHGSINWYSSWDPKPETYEVGQKIGNDSELIFINKEDRFDPLIQMVDLKACKEETPPFIQLGNPVTIPPISNKKYDGIYAKLLADAKSDLSRADSVVIIGYSFPDSDERIRNFLLDSSREFNWKKFQYLNSDRTVCSKVSGIFNGKIETIPKDWREVNFDSFIAD